MPIVASVRMPIVVTCPGCRTRFQVSDKFAGKSGPCPKCKTTIRVPTKQEEVQIQEPQQFAAKGGPAAARVVFRPIARQEFKLQPAKVAAMAGAALLVLLVTWAAGRLIREHLWVRAIGLVLVSPPLVIAGYGLLRDVELEPYRGRALYVRGAACAAAYAGLWAVYAGISAAVMTGELWNWVFVAPPFVIAGAFIGATAFDFEFGNGLFHYCFYVLATIALRWVAGMTWL